MILAKSEIEKLVAKNPPLIENFKEESLQGAGYDLRLDVLYKVKSDAKLGITSRKLPEVEEICKDVYVIKPNEYYLVKTVEKINMPNNLIARILPRSTLFRCGVYIFTALVDPGYKGTLIFGIKNFSNYEFKIERFARVAQIVFEKVEGKTEEYSGRYQGGKVI